ncbi:hypothetical protein KIN20_013714 [Parelaphostrongylus tenuis]|uniref:Uncharacterized protein n=1 Tax=Parelaphostrongylus tenuis TaxID=148309 RepID=A0AAD5QL73_PARTN|nr:hypothetical protein KIN20_013714 [Parelaphostrongylus tenuis]
MSNWSSEMWRNVVNRAVRMLTSSPFGMHFITAFATVDEMNGEVIYKRMQKFSCVTTQNGE